MSCQHLDFSLYQKKLRLPVGMLTRENRPNFNFDGYLVGQNFHFNRVKEFQIGKNFLCLPCAVGTWLGVCKKELRKIKYFMRNKQFPIVSIL